jgi:ketosteroid isomerase-like protein
LSTLATTRAIRTRNLWAQEEEDAIQIANVLARAMCVARGTHSGIMIVNGDLCIVAMCLLPAIRPGIDYESGAEGIKKFTSDQGGGLACFVNWGDDMSHDQNQTGANKELVLRYMRASQSRDVKQMRELLVEDAVRYFPRPGFRSTYTTEGRDNIIGNVPHLNLYKAGTLEMDIENTIAAGPFVVVQFTLRAVTTRGRPYKNYYMHLFELRDGKVSKYWEYCDTLYGAKMLRPEVLAQFASA